MAGDNDDWRQALLERYSPSMGHSINIGYGWRPLVEYLYDFVDVMDCIAGVVQVKEKLGGLRFYVDMRSEAEQADYDLVRDTVSVIESLSYLVCADCGAYGNPGNATDGGSWIRTMCDDCRAVAAEKNRAQS